MGEDGDGWIKCWVETHKYEKQEMVKLLASLKEVSISRCAESLLAANPAEMTSSQQIVSCFLDEIFTVHPGVNFTQPPPEANASDEEKDLQASVFKANLWMLSAQGDRTKKEDWFEREVWLGKNGSLVYYSEKEEADVVYYTAGQIAAAKISGLTEGDSHFP